MDVGRFLQLAVDSRLLTAVAVQAAFDDFLGGARAPASTGSDLLAFGDYLISCGLMTRWQYNMLLKGRSQEFFLGSYKFLEKLGVDNRRESYLVEDIGARRRLILSFAVHPTGVAATIFEIISLAELR